MTVTPGRVNASRDTVIGVSVGDGMRGVINITVGVEEGCLTRVVTVRPG